jgi:phage shock protein PspC (stress-responsive transcriptional regulator)
MLQMGRALRVFIRIQTILHTQMGHHSFPIIAYVLLSQAMSSPDNVLKFNSHRQT